MLAMAAAAGPMWVLAAPAKPPAPAPVDPLLELNRLGELRFLSQRCQRVFLQLWLGIDGALALAALNENVAKVDAILGDLENPSGRVAKDFNKFRERWALLRKEYTGTFNAAGVPLLASTANEAYSAISAACVAAAAGLANAKASEIELLWRVSALAERAGASLLFITKTKGSISSADLQQAKGDFQETVAALEKLVKADDIKRDLAVIQSLWSLFDEVLGADLATINQRLPKVQKTVDGMHQLAMRLRKRVERGETA